MIEKELSLVERVDALSILLTIPKGAEAIEVTDYVMRSFVASGLVKTVTVGKQTRLIRKSLRTLAEMCS
jgi:hypothetical protein